MSFLLTFVFSVGVNAQSLDPSFGASGVASIQYSPNGTTGSVGMLIQPDKKIVLTGYAIVPNQTLGTRTFLVITRLSENGILDNTFGVNGYFTKDLGPYTSVAAEIVGRRIALQPDGKIVATCAIYNQSRLFNDILVLRLNNNGTLDNSFANAGIKQFNIGDYGDGGTCALIQNDGKIVIGAGTFTGGVRHYAVVRMNSNGQLDSSFKLNGVSRFQVGSSNEAPSCILQQPDGKILVGGSSWFLDYDMTVTRLKTNGDLDNTFTDAGSAHIPVGVGDDVLYDMALQVDNKIVMAGYSIFSPNLFFTLARVDGNGTLDYTFDNDGKATYNFGNSTNHGYAIRLQSDGKILMTGDTYSQSTNFDWALLRVKTNGSADSTFNGDGKKIFPITPNQDIANDLAIQSDGKVLISGTGPGGMKVARTNMIDPMQPDCANISIGSGEQFISVAGMRAATNATVQVFNSSWSSVFNQSYSDGTDQVTVNSLAAGKYYVKVSFYSSSWTLLCTKEGYYTVTQPATNPVVYIDSAATVTEKNGTVNTVTVSLDHPTDKPVSVDYTTIDGSAKAGSDYVTKSGRLTIPAGTSGVFMFIDLIDDNVSEPTENFQIRISNPANATLGNTTGTITILDNDQPGPNCNALAINPVINGIVIKGSTAPNVTVQVFNSNWVTIFSNSFVNPDSISVPITIAGTYFVKTTFYSAAWTMICEKSASVDVTTGQTNQCPPGVICISNTCPASTVNLDSTYSVSNLPPGSAITWHTGTPATDNNKLTKAQSQSISQPGNYYAAMNITGSSCYSSTITVSVAIKQCNVGITNPIAYKTQQEQTAPGVQIIPNPFKSEIKLQIPSQKQETMKLSLMNVNGQEVRTRNVQLRVGNNQVVINGLDNLPAGPYFIRMISSSGIRTQKLFRQQ